MRRRGDKGDAGHGAAQPGHFLRDLGRGQLASLAGFGSLRDLDLDFIRIDQIVQGHAEASRCHLTDAGTAVAARLIRSARLVLASFPAVGARANGVAGAGHADMRFGADRPKGHGRAHKAGHDGFGALYPFQRQGMFRLDQTQTGAGGEGGRCRIRQRGKFGKGGGIGACILR